MSRAEFASLAWVWCLVLTAGCDSCSDTGRPTAGDRTSALSLDCTVAASVGDDLGNAAAGESGLAVAGPRGTVHFVTDHGTHTVDLGAKSVGGLYQHQGVYYALEFGGDRVLSFTTDADRPRAKGVFQVGSAPRLMAFGDSVARVVSRDSHRPIVDVDLATGRSVPVSLTGSLVADVEWYDGAFHEAWIRDGKVGSVNVPDEPYRLHAAPSGLYVMHAGSPTLSRVSDQATVTLAGSPIRLGGDLVALVSGSGKVQVVQAMQVVETHGVPVGSNDLAVMDGNVAAVSTGSSGQIQLLALDHSVTLSRDLVQVPFSVGRLYPLGRILWAIGPKSGRVARCTLR